MPMTVEGPNVYTQLRNKAEAQLEAGTTPSSTHWSIGLDALRLLHQLSTNPERAEDALKLLHELQVHQVELDLQNEEITANEQSLVDELELYREAYNCAPLGYFLVDRQGVVIQGNPAAAELFGITQDSLAGQPVDSLLSTDSRPLVCALVQRVAESGVKDSCIVVEGDGANPSRPLLFLASYSPISDHVLLVCCEYPGATN